MKNLVHTLSAILIFAALGFAQNITPTSESKSKAAESVRIYREYDKSKNETKTETSLMPIFGNIIGDLDLNVFYTVQGKTSTPPQSVTITFISSHSDQQFSRDLTIKADDEVFELGEMEYRKIANSNPDFGVTGKLSLSIPVGTFTRIVDARKVHIDLGNDNFNLEKRHLLKLRGLRDAMRQ